MKINGDCPNCKEKVSIDIEKLEIKTPKELLNASTETTQVLIEKPKEPEIKIETKTVIKRIDLAGKGSIDFFCPNQISASRVNTIFSKEPETIEWIDTFESESIFWDIGANIGLYSLYAAIMKNSKVFAFEPSASNYFCLCKNIELNNLDEKISPLCIALSNETKIAELNMSSTEIGSSNCGFDFDKNDLGNDLNPTFQQTSIGFSIDDFMKIYKVPFPNYIKIEVHGIEPLITEGAKHLLEDRRLHSLSIEIDEKNQDGYNIITKNLANAGFYLKQKKHAPIFDMTAYSTVFNFLFARE